MARAPAALSPQNPATWLTLTTGKQSRLGRGQQGPLSPLLRARLGAAPTRARCQIPPPARPAPPPCRGHTLRPRPAMPFGQSRPQLGAVSSSTGCRLTPHCQPGRVMWWARQTWPPPRGTSTVGWGQATGPRAADAALRGEDSAAADEGLTGRRGKLALRRGRIKQLPPPHALQGIRRIFLQKLCQGRHCLIHGSTPGAQAGRGGGRGCALQGNSWKHFWLSQLKHLGGRDQGCCRAQDSTARVISPKCHRAGWRKSVYTQSTAKSPLCGRPSTEHI